MLRINYPTELPIVLRREDILKALREHQVIIVAGETGSGKTTQLPKMCLEAGLGVKGKIGCTQPRRIAALSVSKRIAEELSVTWGQEVGCKIRFMNKTSRNTRIKIMTDGILLAEAEGDPLLADYEAVIIDEAHERSLNIDFLLGYLKTLLPRRRDLKLIITSATIDTELFSRAFDKAPIFEVSGRLYPVEIRYQSGASVENDDEEDTAYVLSAVNAAAALLAEAREGDLLVFMPSERDIRETCDRLRGRYGTSLEVLPLMGSLTNVEQERVFRPTDTRKVIVATNIAETSLTLPHIRFVVDTGLARISRYNPRTRTKRLPIEKISKSSANQRAGRAGRVQAGVCVRLYSQEDYESRAEYTDPEIRRANLAEVVLRMKAARLGEVEEFPFLNPPEAAAVRNGYVLLQELGALDANRNLTSIGSQLARLPVDPTIARMLLQSRRERCLPEMLVIAAGLSIQDPRERPIEKRDQADESHRRFAHPASDFLSLLQLWNAFAKEAESTKSQGQLRRFCKANYLSYMRLREWSDIRTELSRALTEKGNEDGLPKGFAVVGNGKSIIRFDGAYRAIHRSILSGLLSQVGIKVQKNTYRASQNRELTLFPGSALAEKKETRRANEPQPRQRPRSNKNEEWIVSGEIIETSRLFARMVAVVQPAWIEELSGHLVKRAIENVRWDSHSGTASAQERITLWGLTLVYRRINYARVDPDEAKDMLIRNVLLPDDSPLEFRFVHENRKLCDKIASSLARRRRLDKQALEDALVEFYATALPPLSSVRELEIHVRQRLEDDPEFLIARPNDIAADEEGVLPDPESFPDTVKVADVDVPVHYRYEPGGERDGATLAIPLAVARHLPLQLLHGAIPGLREQQVLYLLRALPKRRRAEIGSLDEISCSIANDPQFGEEPLIEAICSGLRRYTGLHLRPDELDMSALPDHLRPRVEVIEGKKLVGGGRDLSQVEALLSEHNLGDNEGKVPSQGDLPAWAAAKKQWERPQVTGDDLPEFPDDIEVTKVLAVPLHGYLAIVAEGSKAALRLRKNKAEAEEHSRLGMDLLLTQQLSKELQEIARQAKDVEKLKPLLVLFASPDEIKTGLLRQATAFLIEREQRYPPSKEQFESALKEARTRLPGLVHRLLGWTQSALELRRSVLSSKQSYPGMRADLDALLPPDFLLKTPYAQLEHFPRYLRAMLVRAERARNDPSRDKIKAARIAPFSKVTLGHGDPRSQALRWMVEELKVSVFAPELGTAYPVSPERLQRMMDVKAP